MFNKNCNWILLLSVILFVFVALFSVFYGSVTVSFSDVLRIVGDRILRFFHIDLIRMEGIKSSAIVIIGNIRLPRVIMASIIGAALGTAGCAAQGLLRNPLADGSTLGIASGASLGAVLVIALGFDFPILNQFGVMLTSMIAGFLSFLVILGFTRRIDSGYSTNTIILTGIIFSLFAGSVTSLVIAFSSKDTVAQIVFWSMGSLAGRGWDEIWFVLPFILIGIGGIVRFSRELDAFSFGEEQARYIGVDVKKSKFFILVMISILVGCSVATAGPIAFVGLVVPHIVRLIVGPSHRRLLPVSVFFGASFLTVADLLCRTIVRPIEMPIGVITSFVGAVVFMLVFYGRRKRV